MDAGAVTQLVRPRGGADDEERDDQARNEGTAYSESFHSPYVA